ncbi:MAG: S8 family peptidase [Paludibacteraceae bacterium]|nr:S8 family peptidase [Paludibacteraceae bacterium]
MSNSFYVRLYDSKTDIKKLQDIAKKTNTIISGQVPYMPDWYELIVSNSSIDNSLEMANYFYETGLFKDVDPGFIFNFTTSACVSDSHFSDKQWNMPAINACDAWGITIGDPNIKIAIIDMGVDLLHNEFMQSLGVGVINSYDCHTEKNSLTTYGDHGTHVGGIIKADHNNGQIAGVAPQCKILPISSPLSNKKATSKELASGFMWAVNQGADVINCSWGDHSGKYKKLHTSMLEEAIAYALVYGRNKKGCVVVFAAGNENSSIDYPGNVFPQALNVGSVGKACYNKSNFSSYGEELDVVAPGEGIYSTIPNNQYATLSGTSMAAPHVSGIAGLILSINPNLTAKQVTDIIESTTRKIGAYSYANSSIHPNGTWNKCVGYGLVDAKKAVTKALEQTITMKGSYSSCTTSKFYLTNCSDKDYNITWTLTNNGSIQNLIEGYSSDKDTVYIHPKFAPGNGNNGSSPDVLTATISNPDGTIAVSRSVTLYPQMTNPPHISVDFRFLNVTGTIYTFSVDNCPNVPDEQLEWTLEYISGAKLAGAINLPISNIRHYTGRSFSYNANPASGVVDTIKVTIRDTKNICGNASETQVIPVIGTRKRISLKATEIGSQLNVSIMEETEGEAMQTQEQAELNENSEYSLELWNAMLGRMRTQPAESANEQINTSGMPQGVYSVSLKENGEIVAQTKVMLK